LAAAFERYKDPFQGQEQGIKWVQRALNRLGFELTVDGILGPRTEAAVLEFQTRAGLEADGLPGPKTCQALAERS
jgi:peptidoglycan hydrolase-like protein with peptidoglycan-binding domain